MIAAVTGLVGSFRPLAIELRESDANAPGEKLEPAVNHRLPIEMNGIEPSS